MFINILFVSLPHCITMKLHLFGHIGLVEILDEREEKEQAKSKGSRGMEDRGGRKDKGGKKGAEGRKNGRVEKVGVRKGGRMDYRHNY